MTEDAFVGTNSYETRTESVLVANDDDIPLAWHEPDDGTSETVTWTDARDRLEHERLTPEPAGGGDDPASTSTRSEAAWRPDSERV